MEMTLGWKDEQRYSRTRGQETKRSCYSNNPLPKGVIMIRAQNSETEIKNKKTMKQKSWFFVNINKIVKFLD